ncbi:S8 family peptidase [Porphyrobacter sp. GA68]|uniref:S8 family peptidase n=1 Tax=Porphyrobacter sp. GA68 TaxID=2883480 RepID=UPI001D18FD30|nr:S8 family peptidase [Porphyrobacter sp. GA68]
MTINSIPFSRWRLAVCVSGLSLAVAACGGGGGGGGAVISSPPPVAAPSPPPPPPPPVNRFDTAEVRRSDGPVYHGAVTAWQNGSTGLGQAIAIIDTGIDRDSPEFAGRISPASRDVAGNASFAAQDDHGTNVALVAAGALDNKGAVGIAHQATIIALRADRPGSCATQTDKALDGCQFFDSDIARGVDVAVAAGAKVINISLGGGDPTRALRDAVGRAARAGVVVVVSAGNDGNSTDAGVNSKEPDPFAGGLLAAGGGNVIIVGSVDEKGGFSSFSNRAGSLAASFLSARGEAICCVYKNGELDVRTEANGDRFVTLFSGTSFAAPQVSGAVALLAQAFPNLTGAEIVRILLDSARDAGASGPDSTYGRGILDIARAFQPRGTTSLAGTTSALALNAGTAIASPAMGDALARGKLQSIVTDSYDRAYGVDLALGMTNAPTIEHLRGAVERQARTMVGTAHGVTMALTVGPRASAGTPQSGLAAVEQLSLTPAQAQGAKALAASAAMRIAPRMQLGLGISQGADGLVAQLQGQDRPAFRIAAGPAGDYGFSRADTIGAALRHEFGAWGVTASLGSGDALIDTRRFRFDALRPRLERHRVSSAALAVDRRLGPVAVTIGMTLLDEDDTLLGGWFHPAFGLGGARTIFLDAATQFDLGQGWRAGLSGRQGFTQADGSGRAAGNITSSAFAVDVLKAGVFQPQDSLGFRLSQPLRVSGGRLSFNLPVDYDYSTESAILGLRELALRPAGRETMAELAWSGGLWGGHAGASLFYRRQPGHAAEAADDPGMAVSWSRGF